jgi:hypothetical protein
MTGAWRLSASETTALATATAACRSGAVTGTTLMTLSARCALMMLADLLQAAWPAAAADTAGIREVAAVAPGGHGDGVAAEWFVHARHGTSGP